jgi:heptosyltransferase-2
MESILIVKIGAIGDVVMSLAMLPWLRRRHPRARITWICGSLVAPLIAQTKMVDEIIEVPEERLLTGSFRQKIVSLLQVWRGLFGRKFDLALTAHSDPRYRLITLPIRAKVQRSWNRKTKRIMPLPGRYHAREYLRLATGGDGPDEPEIEFPKIHVQSNWKKPLIAVAPGGAKNVLADNAQRRWPIEYYAEVISFFSKEYQVVVTGAKSDEWVLPFLPSGSFTNLLGQASLLELIGLYQSANLLITHDSGPLHLAKLAKCPTLALFGPTNPFERTSPSERIDVLWGGEGLPCRPCYDGKTFAPCSNHLCMKSIHPQMVISRAQYILRGLSRSNFSGHRGDFVFAISSNFGNSCKGKSFGE